MTCDDHGASQAHGLQRLHWMCTAMRSVKRQGVRGLKRERTVGGMPRAAQRRQVARAAAARATAVIGSAAAAARLAEGWR